MMDREPEAGGEAPEGLNSPEDRGDGTNAPTELPDGETQHPPDAGSPAPISHPQAARPEPPKPEVFWGYSDLFLFAGLAAPAMLAGFGLVKALLVLFRLHPMGVAELLTEQFVGYCFLFLILVVIFRFQYDRPFWESLGWRPMHTPPAWVAMAGWLTAFLVAIGGYLIRTPTTGNPLTELMQDRTSLILIGIFGVTLGPLAEELAFRGFLQPLLVRSLGALPGILLAAVPFGLLHFKEYGNSWRHVVLICTAGAAFGWMRHATGSTKASTLMHAAYNALFFAALWGSKQAPR